MFSVNNRRKIKIGAILAGVVFLLGADRILKYWALAYLYHQKITVIKNFFVLELFQNDHIAFSIYLPPATITASTTIIIVLLSALLIARITKQPHQFTGFEWGMLLIIVGALSNLYDRLQFGFVIDYFNLAFLPVFNLADMMISAGVIIIGLGLLRKKTYVHIF